MYLYAGDDTYASWVRLGCAVLGYNLSIIAQVADFSSLLLLYNSLLANEKLTSLSLPTSLVTISSYAFEYCSSLTSLSLPTSLVTISSYAFEYCSSLTSLSLPTSLVNISSYAFKYCSALPTVIIPT